MSNLKTNDAVFGAVYWAMYGADAVSGIAVRSAVGWAVRQAVEAAVDWAVRQAVYWAVAVDVDEDSPHQDLQVFSKELESR